MGIGLLILQIGLFLFLFFLSNLFTLLTSYFLLLFLFIGLALIIWSSIVLGKHSFSPLPSPRKSNKLIRFGPYRFIRHPIYSGFILIALCMFLTRPYLIPIVVLLLFILVTNKKANLEERLLEKKYPEYKEYSHKTGKYFPASFIPA